jgi:hypothetical protein
VYFTKVNLLTIIVVASDTRFVVKDACLRKSSTQSRVCFELFIATVLSKKKLHKY